MLPTLPETACNSAPSIWKGSGCGATATARVRGMFAPARTVTAGRQGQWLEGRVGREEGTGGTGGSGGTGHMRAGEARAAELLPFALQC